MASLTVEIDDEILSRARAVAIVRGETLESSVQRLLRVIATPRLSREDMPLILRNAYGMLTPMTDAEAESTLAEHRQRKYGGR